MGKDRLGFWANRIVLLLGIMLLLPAALVLAAGNQESKSQSAAANHPAMHAPIHVIMMSGPEQAAMKKVAAAYTAKTGQPVTVQALGRAEYHAVLPTRMFSHSSGIDVAWIQNTGLPVFVQAKSLTPLNKFISDSKLTPSSYDIAGLSGVGRYKGKIYAVPTDVSTFLMFYRKDLIKSPPQTWSQLFATAKKFSKATNPNSPTRYGITGMYLSGESLPQTWWNIMWSMGGEVRSPSGKVVVDSPAAVKSATYLYRLAKDGLVPPDITQIGWNDQINQFVNGDAAIIVPGWNAVWGAVKHKGGKFANEIAASPIPGVKMANGSIRRTPYAKAWYFAINSASKHRRAAWQFIEYATSPQGMLQYAKTGAGNPPRSSVMDNPAAIKANPMFPLVGKTLKYAHWGTPNVHFNQEVHYLNTAIAQILNLQESPQQALKVAATQIKAAEAQ